jgi:hypothetical protein
MPDAAASGEPRPDGAIEHEAPPTFADDCAAAIRSVRSLGRHVSSRRVRRARPARAARRRAPTALPRLWCDQPWWRLGRGSRTNVSRLQVGAYQIICAQDLTYTYYLGRHSYSALCGDLTWVAAGEWVALRDGLPDRLDAIACRLVIASSGQVTGDRWLACAGVAGGSGAGAGSGSAEELVHDLGAGGDDGA